ncbi:MAG: C-GCAxxG-C-C family protein [Candidatus Thorarchaeota archaeon]|nr:C-GCAxxG-C-C family protein [Candidatus Thorarchaeota archaeon]
MTDKAIRNAKEYFNSDLNCSQSVFRAILEEKGIFFDDALNIAAGFGGGTGLEGNTCGVVNGAVMAIGMRLGQKESDPVKVKEQAYIETKRFLKAFRDNFGTTMCAELTQVDMKNQEALQKASDEGLFQRICPAYLEGAVELVLQMDL